MNVITVTRIVDFAAGEEAAEVKEHAVNASELLHYLQSDGDTDWAKILAGEHDLQLLREGSRAV